MTQIVSSATATSVLLTHVETAMTILREERQALMRGAYDRIGSITDRKTEILTLLEPAIRTVPKTQEAVSALAKLIADSRRNELILRAAREGLAQARRRIAAIARAKRGVVAYQEDGSMISCKPARADTDKSA